MESLGLLIGHMVGDYLAQNDWMAQNKTNPIRLPKPKDPVPALEPAYLGFTNLSEVSVAVGEWATYNESRWAERRGHLACTVHCLCYTLVVWLCSCWWMPMWGLLVCFLAHWPVDRFRLAGWWMRNVSGQAAFASGPLSPWSIVVVDNTFHLLTLFVIGMIHFRPLLTAY